MVEIYVVGVLECVPMDQLVNRDEAPVGRRPTAQDRTENDPAVGMDRADDVRTAQRFVDELNFERQNVRVRDFEQLGDSIRVLVQVRLHLGFQRVDRGAGEQCGAEEHEPKRN
ncbi:MAG: hypothetical protein GY711_10935 [bacterium]|nr:hypothetical protein [bacterium]